MNKDRGFFFSLVHLLNKKPKERKGQNQKKKVGGYIQQKDLGVLVPNQGPLGCGTSQ